MPTATILAPTIHLNGSGQSHLRDAAAKALRAVDEAVNALVAMHPNGRDYYPQGEGALQTAEREHQARMEKLRSVREEVAAYLRAVHRRQEGPVPLPTGDDAYGFEA